MIWPSQLITLVLLFCAGLFGIICMTINIWVKDEKKLSSWFYAFYGLMWGYTIQFGIFALVEYFNK